MGNKLEFSLPSGEQITCEVVGNEYYDNYELVVSIGREEQRYLNTFLYSKTIHGDISVYSTLEFCLFKDYRSYCTYSNGHQVIVIHPIQGLLKLAILWVVKTGEIMWVYVNDSEDLEVLGSEEFTKFTAISEAKILFMYNSRE